MRTGLRSRIIWGMLGIAVIGADVQIAAAGWPWGGKSETPPPIDRTPGVRQRWWKGKPFPPQPRPTGPEASFSDQYHYTHYWPYPLNCQDRAAVHDTVDLQVANGWVTETTLHDYHFDPETNVLNESGMRHLRWIMMSAPDKHRTAFVATTGSFPTNQARLLSVQAAATELGGGEAVPPILLRNAVPYGTSAQQVDLIQRQWMSSTPQPRIEYTKPASAAKGSN